MKRWLAISVLAISVAFTTGCLRNQLKSNLPKDAYANSKLPKPEPLNLPKNADVQLVKGVTPPAVEEVTIPAMPGMPGSPSRQSEMPLPPSKPIIAEADPDEDKKGPVRRLIDNIRDRRDERKDEKEKEKPPLDIPTPTPPTTVPDLPMSRITPPTPPSVGVDARRLVTEAVKKFEAIPDYECKLTRRELVNGKPMPTEELLFQHRREPFSVYMQVTGDSGKGREVLYVKGQNSNKVTVITGKGDNALLGVGKKMEFPLDSPFMTARTRHRIEHCGLTRTLAALQKFVDDDASGHRPSGTLRISTSVERKEYSKPMTELEVLLITGDDSLLPKGGKRKYYFDTDPQSPSHGLPVLIITWENDKEVEYYCFTNFKIPAKLTDADFSTRRLGGK